VVYFFLAGARLAGWSPRVALLEGRTCQWLGKVSFSLYLSHWPLLVAFGPIVGGLLCLPVAWIVWRIVERPSIAISRRLAAPASDQNSGAIVNAAFAVVAFSIFTQGITIPWMIRALGLRQIVR
jgi:peptidoglycan/LPS O-acetylase OafA/YrhL